MNILWIKLMALVALTLVGITAAWAENTLINKNSDNIAIHGYDPVAYFLDAKPILGNPKYRADWQGATWHFNSDSHRRLFTRAPDYYAPQYSGYCAYAASVGQLADVDPLSWSIIDGKLYLNFSQRVKQIWAPRSKEFIGDADTLWPGMVKEHSPYPPAVPQGLARE